MSPMLFLFPYTDFDFISPNSETKLNTHISHQRKLTHRVLMNKADFTEDFCGEDRGWG